jgi:hypothetical protein
VRLRALLADVLADLQRRRRSIIQGPRISTRKSAVRLATAVRNVM